MKKLTVKDLSYKEKLRLLCGDGKWHTCDLDGKLPKLKVTDASMGVRMPDENDNNIPSIAYPSLQMLANTWNIDVVRKYAECVADDCLDAGADVLLGPGVNIKRSPLCGRDFEYFSEDPCLSGIMAREYVAAMQSEGAAACLKHFCCNNLEYNRIHQSSDVDERALREIYLKPFEIAMQAKPKSVMCSYNKINGVQGSENEFGFKILREEFGFDGLIMSDWDAVYDRAKAAKAGLDLEMPFSEKNYEKFVSDFEKGVVSESEVDACAQRVLDYIYGVKELSEGKKRKYTQKERLSFTQTAAEEGIVLLKNNGILPVKKGLSVAMCGQFARPNGEINVCGGGSGQVTPLSAPYDIPEIFRKIHGGKTLYEPAFIHNVSHAGHNPGRAADNAAECDLNIVFAGTGSAVECENGDRAYMGLHPVQVRAIKNTARINPNTIVVLFAGSPVDMSEWIDDVAAVIYAGFLGERCGEAVVNVLTGRVNPSGKLTETFPVRYEDTPAANSYTDTKVTVYEEGIFAGYRYYEEYGVPVLFPFGHGLSYSEFEYKNLKIAADGYKVTVSFEIENISPTDGKEVVQIYVGAQSSCVSRPVKELKAFGKYFIKAGESVKAVFELGKSEFSYWSYQSAKRKTEDGIYKIFVNTSSADIRLTGKIKIENGRLKDV
ncbi:MAG: glycoside hydrolase family 3 C-terminal domain-containing protein [Ruminococcus flavefaciens]|nr:glycoside hydrolase family 3 C-terminal domain-containing protein [Ruminococcus flavefaciens]